METWITIILVVLLITGLIVGLAAICAVVLLGAGKHYRKRAAAQDANAVLCHLPGTNCGSCEVKTCRSFAQQAAWEGKTPPGCPYLSEQTRFDIDEILAKRQTDLRKRREEAKRADQAAGIDR